MNFTDFQEFFIAFYRLIPFLGIAFLLVAALGISILIVLRAGMRA
jgi:hypothetical protein